MDDATLGLLGHLNFMQTWRELATWSDRGVARDENGALITATGSGFPVMANAAFRTDDAAPGDAVVETAKRFFDDRGCGYTLFVRQDPSDEDLDAAAIDAGLVLWGDHYPEMVCRSRLADVRPPDGVELRWVTTSADVEDTIAVIVDAYPSLGFPPEEMAAMLGVPHRLLKPHIGIVNAYAEGQPVGAAMTVLSHGIAGVYLVATRESARGRGVGEAVARAVTNFGFDNGGRANTLQPSPMGQPIYLRMGYEELFAYRMYVRFP